MLDISSAWSVLLNTHQNGVIFYTVYDLGPYVWLWLKVINHESHQVINHKRRQDCKHTNTHSSISI